MIDILRILSAMMLGFMSGYVLAWLFEQILAERTKRRAWKQQIEKQERKDNEK